MAVWNRNTIAVKYLLRKKVKSIVNIELMNVEDTIIILTTHWHANEGI